MGLMVASGRYILGQLAVSARVFFFFQRAGAVPADVDKLCAADEL